MLGGLTYDRSEGMSMRARQLWALTAAALLTAGGFALLAPGSATAAPVQFYPPPPPALTVDAGTVNVGDSVVVHGSAFAPFELISISIRMLHRPKFVPVRYGWGRDKDAMGVTSENIACSCALKADANGKFKTTVVLRRVGTAIITAKG